ncbi:response regulator [Pseudomonas sp. NPDC087346]|uniref:response regulator n=1 Tax=Pseudomonas sp. NPDC087346 TaxID=3364438 RepID=UPI00380BAE30
MNNRILIVDDHPVVTLAIRLLLASEGFDVVAEVDNGADALEKVEALCPSIIILDIGIPVIDGLTVINRIVAKQLPVKIIVLTGLPPAHLVKRCRQLGAHGFVSKQNELAEVVYAVRAVRAHQEYFPDLCIVPVHGNQASREHELLELLSGREFGVMQQLLLGMSNRAIAQSMLLSDKTVSTYKTRLLHKLNVSDVVGLYALAKRNGLV